MSSDEGIARTAEAQHGVFTHEQARGAGFGVHAVRHRLDTGRWEAVDRGVYRLPGTGRTWQQRLITLTFAAGPVAAASHRSAAALLHLPGFSRDVLEVTTPRPRRHRRDEGIVHRWRPFPENHLTTVEGIPVTRVARTLVDLAGVVSAARTERAVDHALASGLTTPSELRDAFDALAGRGRAGIALMRRLLEERGMGYVAPAGELEARFLDLVRTSNLPEPIRQLDVGDGEGWVGRVDVAYPAARLLVELDGRRHHTQLLDLQSDRARDNRLMAGGWRVLRLTWNDVTREPEQALKVLGAALNLSGDAQHGQDRVQRHQFGRFAG